MDTSIIENEKWLVKEIAAGDDGLEHLKAFFTCAFIAGSTHSREFTASRADSKGAMDGILEREWDKTVTVLRGIVASGALAEAKARMQTSGGFDA